MKKIQDPMIFKKIKEFLTSYLPVILSKSPNTIEAYRITLNLFISFLISTGKDITEVSSGDFSAEMILGFLDWLVNDRKNSMTTRDLRLTQMRQFCKFLKNQEMLDMADYSDIQMIRHKSNKDADSFIYLSIEEMRDVIALPDVHDRYGLRDEFFLYLLYDSGCRDQEILSLKIKDLILTPSGAELHIVGKGKKYRVTPVSEKVTELFYKYCAKYHPSIQSEDPIFYTIRKGEKKTMSPDNVARFINKYEKVLRKTHPQIPHLHPHLFRHTRAMHLYMAGMPLALVSEWLGHSQITTTMIYARATIEMKREAVSKLEINELVQPDTAHFIYENDEEMIRRLYGLK